MHTNCIDVTIPLLYVDVKEPRRLLLEVEI